MKRILTMLTAANIVAACAQKPTPQIIKTISFETKTAKPSDNKIKHLDKISSIGIFSLASQTLDKTDLSFNQGIVEALENYAGTSVDKIITADFLNQQVIEKALANNQILITNLNANEEIKVPQNKAIIAIDSDLKTKNTLNISFETIQAAFLAGYFAARYIADSSYIFDQAGTEGLKVTAIGSTPSYNNVSYMAGFQQGVSYWNSKEINKDQQVEFVALGEDVSSHFTNSSNVGAASSMVEKLKANKVDVILAANGAQIIDILKAYKENKYNTKLIGTEIDQAKVLEEYSNMFLTSIVKDFESVTSYAMQSLLNETDYPGLNLGASFIADISNNFVSLADSGANDMTNAKTKKLLADEELMAAAKKANITFTI